MLAKNISSEQLIQNANQLLEEVSRHRVDVLVGDAGQAKVAIIPIDVYNAWFRQRQEAFRIIDDIAEKSRVAWQAEGLTEEDMLEIVADEIEDYRRGSPS